MIHIHIHAHLHNRIRAGRLAVDAHPRRDGVDNLLVGAGWETDGWDGERGGDAAIASADEDRARPVLVVGHGGRDVDRGGGEEGVEAGEGAGVGGGAEGLVLSVVGREGEDGEGGEEGGGEDGGELHGGGVESLLRSRGLRGDRSVAGRRNWSGWMAEWLQVQDATLGMGGRDEQPFTAHHPPRQAQPSLLLPPPVTAEPPGPQEGAITSRPARAPTA